MAAEKEHVGNSEKENDKIQDPNSPIMGSFSVEVLQLMKEAQQTHGLRHGDYQRYRQYCARRLRRIRKSLHFLQGTKHKVQPKKISYDTVTDIRFLHLPLIDAERCWAYSMQLKAESNTEPRKKFHLVGKLKKAVHHAELLTSLCESDKCDARTKLEAQAYCAWMKGTLQFELESWRTAMEQFTSARTIYEKLSSAFVDEIRDIYIQRCEEITPNIRYCAYNIGDDSALEDLRAMRLKTGGGDPMISRIDELMEKTREKQSASLSEVTWRCRTVPVKNERVRLFLLSIAESEKQLQEADTVDSKVSIYETLIKELIDAQQSLKDDLRDDPNLKAVLRGQQVEGKVPNNIYLHTYLAYLRQTKTIERNLLMVDSLKANLPGQRQDDSKKITKPQDLARLYEIIIQSLSEIPNLPGLEEDSAVSQEINTQIIGYRAHRCYYQAQTYVQAKKWREAIALYERVLTYAKDALEGYKNSNSKGDHTRKQLDIGSLQELIKEVEGQKYTCHASSILDVEDLSDNMTKVSVKNNKKPLDARLDDYFEDPSLTSKKPNLTQFPPEFEPIPAKPLFFDLALSLVQLPDLEDRVEQRKQAQGGLTGFVKGWLWGGGKK